MGQRGHLREAMAMGKPVIVGNRGMLPELVDHGVSGLVVDDTPELLAEVALQLLRHPKGGEPWEKRPGRKPTKSSD